MEDIFIQELSKILRPEQIRLKEAMKNHTSFHTGGEADVLATPSTADEVRALILLCRRMGKQYYVIGNGSNLLVDDNGFRGLIIKLTGNFSQVKVNEDCTITAQAGVSLARLANIAAEHGLAGLEFASGIPGTLGGAVVMNAGAYGGEMKHCIEYVSVMDEEGNISTLSNEKLKLGYRTSILQGKGLIILEAVLRLVRGDKEVILARMKELNMQRSMKQPLDRYSAGSTFKRPPDNYASKLIQEAGLKGYQVGGAAVSDKHCGFIINNGNATSGELIKLIEDVIRIVEEKFCVRLEPEIKYLDEFNSGWPKQKERQDRI